MAPNLAVSRHQLAHDIILPRALATAQMASVAVSSDQSPQSKQGVGEDNFITCGIIEGGALNYVGAD